MATTKTTFFNSWLPNIVCGLFFGAGGCLVSYWLGVRHARMAEWALGNLLAGVAKQLGMEVVRDKKGRATGQLNRTITVPTA